LCEPEGLECEYGHASTPSCDHLLRCTERDMWELVEQTCAGSSESCPAKYGSEGLCKVEGVVCAYPEGTCACETEFPPTPGGPSWVCIGPTPGCSAERPSVGSPCTKAGQECDYGACEGGVELECKSFSFGQNTFLYWTIEPVPCPATG
jgi:hypothetical protein